MSHGRGELIYELIFLDFISGSSSSSINSHSELSYHVCVLLIVRNAREGGGKSCVVCTSPSAASRPTDRRSFNARRQELANWEKLAAKRANGQGERKKQQREHGEGPRKKKCNGSRGRKLVPLEHSPLDQSSSSGYF